MPHVLVVDDDELILALLENVLRRAGYRASTARDGVGMRRALDRGDVDLILLDLKLDAEHGFDLAREVNERHGPPIIFLSGIDDPTEKATGLELGGDDYVTKPFDQRELLARIQVVLRRQHEASPPASRRLAFDGFVLDLDAHELRGPDDEAVNLTHMELQILACLAQRPRQVLSRNEISRAVSGRERDRRDRTIDVVVSKLRRKLIGASASCADPIETVRRAGYKFVAQVAPVGQADASAG